MGRNKIIGIILILIGFTIPLASFALVTGYDSGIGLSGSLPKMELVITEGKYINCPKGLPLYFIKKLCMWLDEAEEAVALEVKPPPPNIPHVEGQICSGVYDETDIRPCLELVKVYCKCNYYEGRKAIPYVYISAFGIVLICIGIGVIIVGRARARAQTENEGE